ncbi:MAG: alkaline phosphatase D family protein [Acidimicrobiales bacterium]
MTDRIDRRSFLRRAGGAGAAALLAPVAVRHPARAQPDPALAPFLHGVASGDPRPDAVVLWTRITTVDDDPVEVDWVVAHDPGLADVVATGVATAVADRDHTVKVDVPGLEPGRWYFYGFTALGACSLTGRTKTAPAGAVDRVRFAVVSCANYQAGFFNAYAALAERDDLDAIVHLGDYLYEGGESTFATTELPENRGHQPTEEILSLGDYRQRHGQYKLDVDLRRLHQLFPFITTWDDHESTNDSWRDGAENHTPGEEGDWGQRKAWAQQAYEEWMPIRVDDPGRIYRTLRYGDLLDLIVLDTRLEGRDEQIGSIGTTILEEEIRDPDRHLMSPEQRQFWFDELTASQERGVRWRLVGQQVMMAPLNVGALPNVEDLLGVDLPDLPLFLGSGPANALNPDQWDGYHAERERFYDHLIDNAIGNVVVLTGDIHTSWASDLSTDPFDPLVDPIAVELVTTSVTSGGFEEILGSVELAQAAEPFVMSPAFNPHIRYVDLTRRGYLILDVTPERVQADWHHLDTVFTRSAAQSVSASWQVLDGANRLSEAAAPAPAGLGAPAAPEAVAACAAAVPAEEEVVATEAPAPSSARLPATGASGPPLLVGAALLGAAGLTHVVRRRTQVGQPR